MAKANDNPAGIGHNSGETPSPTNEAGKRIRSVLDRIERLEEEKKGLADDIRDVYAEAKGTGLDAKILRKLVKLRKMDADKRREEEELLDLYGTAAGVFQ